jgi:hypothetical protein
MLADDNARWHSHPRQQDRLPPSINEHLVFDAQIREVLAARAHVGRTDPNCRLIQLVDAKLDRLAAEVAPTPWAA